MTRVVNTHQQAVIQVRKRDTSPEAALRHVLANLEASDTPNHPTHRRAVHLLLVAGPYLCAHLLQREREQPDPEISLIRAELVAFLREAVRLRGSDGFGYGIGLTGPVSFGGKPTKVGVLVAITASLRDAAILQLLALLEQVGLNQVRRCAAPDCDRLFVKHYRQTFHSLRCQQREIKRRKRDRDRERDDRERDAQQTRARRRRVTRKRGHR